VKAPIEAAGGKLIAAYMTTGANGVVIIAEAPDGSDAIAAGMAAAASGTLAKGGNGARLDARGVQGYRAKGRPFSGSVQATWIISDRRRGRADITAGVHSSQKATPPGSKWSRPGGACLKPGH
jgi:hypothetical protein